MVTRYTNGVSRSVAVAPPIGCCYHGYQLYESNGVSRSVAVAPPIGCCYHGYAAAYGLVGGATSCSLEACSLKACSLEACSLEAYFMIISTDKFALRWVTILVINVTETSALQSS